MDRLCRQRTYRMPSSRMAPSGCNVRVREGLGHSPGLAASSQPWFSIIEEKACISGGQLAVCDSYLETVCTWKLRHLHSPPCSHLLGKKIILPTSPDCGRTTWDSSCNALSPGLTQRKISGSVSCYYKYRSLYFGIPRLGITFLNLQALSTSLIYTQMNDVFILIKF